MKRRILVVAVILGLILVAGLSVQLNLSSDTHGSENALHTSNILKATDPHSAEATDPRAEAAMDPDMPGMNHSNTQLVDGGADRPLKATLGTFGIATSIVLSGALILRQRDDKERKNKIESRKGQGESQ